MAELPALAGIDRKIVNRVLLWAVDRLCASEAPAAAVLNRMAASGVKAQDIYTLGHSAALFELAKLAQTFGGDCPRCGGTRVVAVYDETRPSLHGCQPCPECDQRP